MNIVSQSMPYGEIIEYYPQDKYGPSCLICGITEKNRFLHVLCSLKPVWIITSYDPTLNSTAWGHNYTVRRKKR